MIEDVEGIQDWSWVVRGTTSVTYLRPGPRRDGVRLYIKLFVFVNTYLLFVQVVFPICLSTLVRAGSVAPKDNP